MPVFIDPLTCVEEPAGREAGRCGEPAVWVDRLDKAAGWCEEHKPASVLVSRIVKLNPTPGALVGLVNHYRTGRGTEVVTVNHVTVFDGGIDAADALVERLCFALNAPVVARESGAAIEQAAADKIATALREHGNEDWVAFAKAVGEAVNCLYSQFPDQNDHILAAVRKVIRERDGARKMSDAQNTVIAGLVRALEAGNPLADDGLLARVMAILEEKS